MPPQEFVPRPDRCKEEIGARLQIPETEMNDLDQGTVGAVGLRLSEGDTVPIAVKAGKF
jgi:hypothetical protein